LNLANAHGHSVREVIATAERVSSRRIPINVTPRRAGDPAVLIGARSGASNARLGAGPIQITDPDQGCLELDARGSSSGEGPIALTCSSSLDPKCRNRLPNIAGRPTGRRLHRAAHKNSGLDNESGSAAIRILRPRDNAVLRADQLGGRHRQLE
jgi:hypothetical protein